MANWQLQDAKAKFSELVDRVEKEGAQIITRRGVETVAVIPIDEWKRLTATTRPNLKDWLLDPGARLDDFDKMIPPRGKARLRKTVDFD